MCVLAQDGIAPWSAQLWRVLLWRIHRYRAQGTACKICPFLVYSEAHIPRCVGLRLDAMTAGDSVTQLGDAGLHRHIGGLSGSRGTRDDQPRVAQ